jgi:CheY-like chemotaxis protein
MMPKKPDEKQTPLLLIVDDVETNIEVLANLLGDRSYGIAFATSGEQALAMVEELDPDLILLDIMMPGMDGLEVCRVLKRRPSTREIPIIFLTARTEVEDIAGGFEAGAVDYVTKPFQAAELLARVHVHIELKTTRDAQKRLIEELHEALEEVRLLSGLLPICSFCKKIRDDQGYWQQVEDYISRHSQATFSHGICPQCMREHFPDLAKRFQETNGET